MTGGVPIRGRIFDLQHCSLHDSPGIRSTVFLKGYPLSCWWCSNPESQEPGPQLLFFRQFCIGCGACAEVCPNEALLLDKGTLVVRRKACTLCGACVPACRQEARALSGRTMSVKEVCDAVHPYWRIFQTSGGGVTLSRGEALAQGDFLFALLAALHDKIGFHTYFDTCGKAPWAVLERMLPYLDMILLDIKHMDKTEHQRATGLGNDDILRNARNLAKRKISVLTRIPLIPGLNDDENNLSNLEYFLREKRLDRGRDYSLPCLWSGQVCRFGHGIWLSPGKKPPC